MCWVCQSKGETMENAVWTHDRWTTTIEGWVRRTLAGHSDRAIGVVPYWIETREIRVMWEEGILPSLAAMVAEEIRVFVSELGLGVEFEVILYGSGWEESDRRIGVSDYIRPATINGELDHRALFDLSYGETYRQERQHADVYITTRPFVDDRVSWGAAIFEHGCMMLTLWGKRQHSRQFIRSVVRHEMCHLLGMPIHCDDIGVEGWAHDTSCNMHYALPSSRLCGKCREYLGRWWLEIDRLCS
ncbi:hypothetical protein HOI83_01410 [Candidatus Uhrbacteria bacterium]|nr:hypothetical protein [Candidatus Uhrbacteria bacterium]